jgi:hypothetical protein
MGMGMGVSEEGRKGGAEAAVTGVGAVVLYRIRRD